MAYSVSCKHYVAILHKINIKKRKEILYKTLAQLLQKTAAATKPGPSVNTFDANNKGKELLEINKNRVQNA